MNIRRDLGRCRGEREQPGGIPEQAGSADVERSVLARERVGEVSRALGRLPPTRAAILRAAAAETEGVADRAETATRMARYRARRALQLALRTASVSVGWHGTRPTVDPTRQFSRSGG